MAGIGADGSPWFYSTSPGPWMHVLTFEDLEVNLANLIHTCSNYVSLGNLEGASSCLEKINLFASADGTTMQRIAFLIRTLAEHPFMLEARCLHLKVAISCEVTASEAKDAPQHNVQLPQANHHKIFDT